MHHKREKGKLVTKKTVMYYLSWISSKKAKESIDEEDPRPTSSNGAYINSDYGKIKYKIEDGFNNILKLIV